MIELVALEFANTRSSSGRDRIGTLPRWQQWIGRFPSLREAGRAVSEERLCALLVLRDDVQTLLRSVAAGRWDAPTANRVAGVAGANVRLSVGWQAGRPALLVPPRSDPARVLSSFLARATLDLVVGSPPLRACGGRDCLKVFVATRRDRRWCDSAVCGNRARVRSHHQRNSTASRSIPAAAPPLSTTAQN
jgi:predicted RNA-binding Zn ribbon-like protein